MLLARVNGIEARLRAEARAMSDRMTRLESRLDRIATAVRGILADATASDGEEE